MKTPLALFGVITCKSGVCPPEKHLQIWSVAPFPYSHFWSVARQSDAYFRQWPRGLSEVASFLPVCEPHSNFVRPMQCARDRGVGEGASGPVASARRGARHRAAGAHFGGLA